jgi:hypothetical protein
MAEQKLVSIRVDAKDRRRRLVRLTPKGFAMVESLSPVVDASARKVVVGLTEAEEVRLLQLLDKAVISTAKMHAERRTRRKDSDAAGLGAGLGQPSEGLAAGLAAARLARMAAASVDEIVDEDDDPSSDT